MSLPYESNVTNWGKIRCVKAWIEYPFANDGDTTSKIYNMECVCKNTAYVAPAFSDVMSSAAVADVIDLPFAADATAYFLGDFDFQPADGGLIRFVRKFAPVPSTRTRAIGSYVYTFPAFRRWTNYNDPIQSPATIAGGQALLNYNAQASRGDRNITAYLNDGEAYSYGIYNDHGPAIMPPQILLRKPLTVQSYAKVTYTFVYATAVENVTPDTLFAPSHPSSVPVGEPSDYFNDFLGAKTGNGADGNEHYLYDSSDGVQVAGAVNSDVDFDESSPTLTDYQDNYIDTLYINAEARVRSWFGNIFMKETISVLAK